MLPFTPTLAALTVTLMAAGFVLVSLFMMLVILIQKPKGGGLSGAFGGAGGGESAFMGAKMGDFLTYLTVACFIGFLLLAMGLTWTINPTENRHKQDRITQTTDAGPGAGATEESETPPAETPPAPLLDEDASPAESSTASPAEPGDDAADEATADPESGSE